jgi:predicted  nucleic acid-binding Zn-ribbon protein
MTSASNDNTYHTITELETELNQINQQYTQTQQEVQTLQAKLVQKDTECTGTKDSTKQRLGEREDQLHNEREERKVVKEEITVVSHPV